MRVNFFIKNFLSQVGNEERTSYICNVHVYVRPGRPYVCMYMCTYVHTHAVLYTNYIYARFVSQILSFCCVTGLCDNAGLLLSLAGRPFTCFLSFSVSLRVSLFLALS